MGRWLGAITTCYTKSCSQCEFVTNDYGTEEAAQDALDRHVSYKH